MLVLAIERLYSQLPCLTSICFEKTGCCVSQIAPKRQGQLDWHVDQDRDADGRDKNCSTKKFLRCERCCTIPDDPSPRYARLHLHHSCSPTILPRRCVLKESHQHSALSKRSANGAFDFPKIFVVTQTAPELVVVVQFQTETSHQRAPEDCWREDHQHNPYEVLRPLREWKPGLVQEKWHLLVQRRWLG
jgi:hypothetical protein